MKTKEVVLQNDGNKLCRQLISLVDFSKGSNYVDTHIEVRVFDNSIEVSTFCTNEYGSTWCNENYTEVNKSDIPFFTLKKLGMLIDTRNEIELNSLESQSYEG